MKFTLSFLVGLAIVWCGNSYAGGAMNGGGGTDDRAATHDPSLDSRRAKALLPTESLEDSGELKPNSLDHETQRAIDRGEWKL